MLMQENVTDAHVKMAEVPLNESTIIEVHDNAGNPAPFPLLKCRNVFVLPGIPDLLRKKFRSVKAQLAEMD